jgi:two-component system sensor histidine kinase PilS (NtrC family)
VTQEGYAVLGLTAMIAVLAAVMAFAVMRFAAGVKDSRRHLREGGAETVLLSAALQEAVNKLKAQEKAMSARAVASEQLSAEIVESITAGLLVVARSGAIEIFNPAGRRMIGVAETALGGDYHDVLAAVPPLVAVIEECLTSGAPIVRRAVRVESGPRPLHFGVTVSLLGEREAPRGVICLFSDLTKVMELEEQLRLKETLARLGELTAGIAHEFRNGLATIHGYGRLLDPDAVPPKYRPYIEGIRQETDALRHVVTNFLNFARPEQVTLTTVDLAAVVRRTADDLRHELPDGTAVTVEGTFGQVHGDELLLRQVIGNLMRNAAEACEGAGTVPAIVIRGESDPSSPMARFAIEDNGPGIPEDARERIFQPFFTTRSRGTGLGLAIVQKIVVIHNGRVLAEPAPGGGARFQITLPTPER